MAHARRAQDAIELADDLDASDEDDVRIAGSTFLAMLRSLSRLSDADRKHAIEVGPRGECR